MDRGAQSAGERADRTTVRNAAGPLGKGNAPGRDRQPRCRESFFGDALSSGVGTAFHGGTSQAAQCPSTVGSRTAVGGNSKRARGSPGSRRSQRQLGWHPLGCEARRSVRGSSRSAGGSRTASGWLALATLPRPLSPPAPLPSTLAERRAKPKDKIKPKYHVPAEHPWRKPWNRTFLSCEKPDISTLR